MPLTRALALLVAFALGCGSPSDRDGGLDDSAVAEAGAPRPLYFVDITESAAVRWVRRPPDDLTSLADRFGNGVCVLDLDGEAPPELFFAARPAGESRLFRSDGPLLYRDATDEVGLAAGEAIGCVVLDADGDDDDDLVVTTVGGAELWVQDGGRFSAVGLPDVFESDVIYGAVAAGDVDGDGDLDLVVAGAWRINPEALRTQRCFGGTPCSADLARSHGAPSRLLLREGDGYVDGTSLAPDLALHEPTLVVAVGDFLERGEPSIFVGNDLGGEYPNRLLARDGDAFVDVAMEAGFATNARGYGIDAMGLSSGDLDANGSLEHVVSAFEQDLSAVFECLEPGVCLDVGEARGMVGSSLSFRWAPVLLDVNLDGALDLFEAAGHYYRELEILEIGYLSLERQPMSLGLGEGDGTLSFAPSHGEDGLSLPRRARSAARVDLDDDGRLDLVVTTVGGRQAVLHNRADPVGRWVGVTLRGRAPNTRAVGAQVTVVADGVRRIMEMRAGEGYLGSFDRRLVFGLGPASGAVVEVRWPDGAVSERALAEAELDSYVTLDAPP